MKPILFNTEMVRAILDGRKTVTRRVVKPQPPKEIRGTYECMDDGNFQLKVAPYESIYDYEIKPLYCPGDILYVRESWAKMCCFDCTHDDCETNIDRLGLTIPCNDGVYIYKATDLVNTKPKWRPSIHMPKEAARIFLRVTGVRVERLQDITEEQAEKEGFSAGSIVITGGPWGIEDDPDEWTAKDDFSALWSITIKKADLPFYGWDANPWVWVIEFERISKEEAQKGGDRNG